MLRAQFLAALVLFSQMFLWAPHFCNIVVLGEAFGCTKPVLPGIELSTAPCFPVWEFVIHKSCLFDRGFFRKILPDGHGPNVSGHSFMMV